MQNINGFYSTYYQTPFYHYNNNLFYSPQNNTINTFLNYNFKNIVTSRTPSPPHHKRDIINLGYNTHFKNSSNSNILFLKLKDNNTLNNNMLINTNIHLIKNNSPFKHNFPFNVPKNDNKNIFLPNNSYYGESRNLKIRKIIINNMNLNNHKHGINYYINNSGNKSLDLINNDLSKNIHFRNINAHSHNNSMNSLNNIKLKKFLHLNDNNFNNIITIKNYNNYNQNKSATPILQYKINNIKVINDKNYQHNNDASNDIDFSKIQNLKNNIHIPILKTNKQNNRKENSVEMKSFENTPNTDRMINKNNLQSEIIQNNNILINFPLKSNNIIFNENKKKQENINIIPIDKKKYFYFGEIGIIKGDTRKMINKESNPTDNFNITEFQIIKQIGKGGFGKIYCIKWIKNKGLYALKKYNLTKNELNYFQAKVEIVKYLTKKIEHNNGFIKIYGDKCIQQKNPNEIHYYIIMELGERDWFKELKIREAYFMHYSENELFDIITQLVKTLSLMQKNNVAHRDIKLQNVILCKGIYKLCDFDESEILNQNTEICQTIKGSKLYMSPILYYALKRKEENVIHNPYKSDVFSLGMCSLFAASFTRKLLLYIFYIFEIYSSNSRKSNLNFSSN